MQAFFQQWHETLLALAYVVGAILLGIIIDFIVWKILFALVHRTRDDFDDKLLLRARAPSRVILPLVGLHIIAPLLLAHVDKSIADVVVAALAVALIAAFTWLLLTLLGVVEKLWLSKYRLDTADNLDARKLHTQVRLLRRILSVVVVVLAVAAMLMSFDTFRKIGTGILASAGLAGVIIGIAAQRTLSNLLAGFQIAISQPIRIDDVLVIEGEWGKVEEITLTYVVLRIWDMRRLIIPLSAFIEKPFQNWTRVSADMLGTVYLYVDYTLDVEALRAALQACLASAPEWDGKVANVQVTDTDSKAMQVRALMSASDSSKLWDLRCKVREALIQFVRTEYPQCLPHLRADFAGDPIHKEWSHEQREHTLEPNA